jgi:hypothetical protein
LHLTHPVCIILYCIYFSIIVGYGEYGSHSHLHLEVCWLLHIWFLVLLSRVLVIWRMCASTHSRLDMASSDLLCNLDISFRISRFHKIRPHIFSSPFTSISCIPGSTHTSLSICLYQCGSRAVLVSIHSISFVFVYLFSTMCISFYSYHQWVLCMHVYIHSFIHSGVVVSFELPKPLSSRLTHWLRRFLILHLQVLYSMDTHTGISICGLPLWIQGNACVYPFLFLYVILHIYLNIHIHLQLPEMSVVPEYVYPLVCSLWCDGLSGYPQRV